MCHAAEVAHENYNQCVPGSPSSPPPSIHTREPGDEATSELASYIRTNLESREKGQLHRRLCYVDVMTVILMNECAVQHTLELIAELLLPSKATEL